MTEKMRSPTTHCGCMLYLLLQKGFCQHHCNSSQTTCWKKSPHHSLGWSYTINFFCLCQRSTSTLCLRRQVGHQKVPPVLLLPSFCSCNQSWWAQLQGNVGKNCISFLLKYGFPCFLVIVRQIQNLASEELSHIVRLLQNSPQLSLLGCSRT